MTDFHISGSFERQNSLLITQKYDNYFFSGQQETVPHHEHIENWADKLAFYTQAKEARKHVLPKDTKEALQHKIDPNMGERERKTVQALLYTSGGKIFFSLYTVG